ncbi:Gfo/Idh/MocA family oxidoreductase [Actinotignum urinale]|uniref:Gfo/Idh/MocA family oxidoreductase n=1 Tax=Actinotignum urinale TaxID=190146 RepID=A0ABU5G4X5_9ACTO|nr:Gfo/Idh/MocA family oxidoreductase [Actinotignum urinale]MDY5132420.1 Gfo/Idh/MocA family oxidoreductase [Actinotignum urinale]
MKVGLLGAGRAGRMHARILASRVEELVIADPNDARRTQVCEELRNLPEGVSTIEAESVENLIKNTSLDALVIVSPTNQHAEQLVEGSRLGIPMFTEKPVSTSLENTLNVRDALRKAGARVQVGFQRRFDEAYTRARQGIASGDIGELRRVSMGTMDQAPAAREFLAASGGIYIDCLIHDFDILRWVTGREVTEVYAMGTALGLPDFTDFDDVCETVLSMRMEGDVLVNAQSSRFNGQGYDVRMELHGTQHTYAVGFDEKLPLTSMETDVTYPSGEPWVDFIARFASCYEREMDAFLAAVRGEVEIAPTVEDAVESLRVAEAAKLSLRENRPVSLSEIAS